ncbi:MAG: anion transporter, partial [Proteobacteria bacterium]|nr:anion transporter [Pseudomonadota bacterium]
MFFKTKGFQLCIAFGLGIIVLLLPRPEGTKFSIVGDKDQKLFQQVSPYFKVVSSEKDPEAGYMVEAKVPGSKEGTAEFLMEKAAQSDMKGVQVVYENGLSPKAMRFLAVLVVLVFLFVVEPIPLEITAICIGVFLVIMGISDAKAAWAPY